MTPIRTKNHQPHSNLKKETSRQHLLSPTRSHSREQNNEDADTHWNQAPQEAPTSGTSLCVLIEARYLSCWDGEIVNHGAIEGAFDPGIEYHTLSKAGEEVIDEDG